MSSMLQAVTDREFDRVVEASRVPVLVEFWKPGCGHCRALMAELERLHAGYGNESSHPYDECRMKTFRFPPNWKSRRFPQWRCIKMASS